MKAGAHGQGAAARNFAHHSHLSCAGRRWPFADGMAREMCYRCFWPKPLCWCATIVPMETRTRFAFLMHPKEFKQEKAGTGRLTHLCLPNSQIFMGQAFDAHAEVRDLLADPRYYPVLLYPGREALNLSEAAANRELRTGTDGPGAADGARQGTAPATLQALRDLLLQRRLLVVMLDATWSGARKMLRQSPGLQRLPRLMFTPAAPSRYVIKQQPQEGCLSTLEATHELLLTLEQAGLDTYALPGQLLGLFQRMQDFQLRCAADPHRQGYRHRAYKAPEDRTKPRGRSGSRRENYLQQPS